MRLCDGAGLFLLGAASLLAAPFPAPLHAQQSLGFAFGEPVGDRTSQAGRALRTIDEERLFQQSEFGQRVAREIERASRALEAQNDELLAELTAREAELTEQRGSMTLEEFRAAAVEFDVKAETTRREQAEKRQRLVQFEEAERRRFFTSVAPVLQEVLAQAGAQILIDARAVLIGVPGMDMTPEAIAAIDEVLGDGGEPAFPLNLP
ncbi:MAG: OmpH family outer membrane protein [Rhodobacteraceae bacterium]|nr:MAG: OmpH family outer membrane protein [Paracoccaceae bacterium]